MFYLFHHMPKCGGTSFTAYLESIFRVLDDYHNPGGPKADLQRFDRFVRSPKKLRNLTSNHCVAGHYNLDRIFLWERYPELEEIEHRKFSVLRHPFDTARSGAYFSVKRGRAEPFGESELLSRMLGRKNFFAKTLGIRDANQVDEVLSRYWFVAPLDQLKDAVKILESTTGRSGIEVPFSNTTDKPHLVSVEALRKRFAEANPLDHLIYERAVERFCRDLPSLVSRTAT
ncbi:MAG: hypothetical protein AAF580_02125 [Pseudomonadota bacterium]